MVVVVVGSGGCSDDDGGGGGCSDHFQKFFMLCNYSTAPHCPLATIIAEKNKIK